MKNLNTNPKVDDFISNEKKWQAEFIMLRNICLDTELIEDLKWGKPCYTLDGGNVVLIHGFKEYCALLFMKGAIMQDDHGILIQQTENVQSGRQIRFKNLEEITKLQDVIKEYILNSIEVEKSGAKITIKKTTEYEVPEEFQRKLDEMPWLREAFEKLTPGRQRGYLFFFGGAKQAKTREARIEKYLDKIIQGKGLDD